MASTSENFTLVHVCRDQNERADLLAKLASTQKRGQQKSMIHENLSTPTVDWQEIQCIEGKTTWMTPFLEYLNEDWIPGDPSKARRMVREASKYTLIGQHLYWRGFAFPLLICVDGEEVAYIVREVHEGVCDMHIRGHALACKITRAGYYWPTLRRDCMDYVKKYDKCQRFAEGHKAPLERLHSVDILGPFPIAPSQVKFLVVTIDYFTKWVKVESVTTISSERIKHFFWKKIIYRFGIPAEIVSDNGTQFTSRTTAEFFEGLRIKQLFTSVEHPQSNGQTEAANRVILRGLQKRLEEAKGRWAEELPQVLCSYHITPPSTTNKTPFRLTFGTEAMIPVEIEESSPRTALFEPSGNEEELRVNLDMLQEIREIAHVREYVVKARTARKYDKRIVPRNFKPQDLAESNKLTLIWEGPFRVLEEVGWGASFRKLGWQEGSAHMEYRHLTNVLQLSYLQNFV
ncbi:Tf2-11, partial [Mucuna pruriens]